MSSLDAGHSPSEVTIWGYDIGIMEKKMEATIIKVYRVYIGV